MCRHKFSFEVSISFGKNPESGGFDSNLNLVSTVLKRRSENYSFVPTEVHSQSTKSTR